MEALFYRWKFPYWQKKERMFERLCKRVNLKGGKFLKKRREGVGKKKKKMVEKSREQKLKKGRFGPKSRIKTIHRKQIVLIGIGCNVGKCRYRFLKLLFQLEGIPATRLVATSPLYLNPPFGYLSQPHFWNGVIAIVTNLSPFRILFYLQRLENRHHRVRVLKNGPRTLDLDLLWWEGVKMETSRLTLPHPGFRKRKSVYLPLQLLGKVEKKGTHWLNRN